MPLLATKTSSSVYDRYDKYIVRRDKAEKYTHLHKKLKHQSKIFRKKYEIEQMLERKERDAKERCNIYKGKCDEECSNIIEDIENLEQKLKSLERKMLK